MITVETVGCTDPDLFSGVFKNYIDVVIGKIGRIVRTMFEVPELIAVIAVEAFSRSYPQQAVGALFYAHHRVKGKAVSHVQLTECEILRPELSDQGQE